jgi:protein tyrosine phosphatase (PTP) superfamily phosphohydrolase (DUF442 family)
MTDMSPQVQAAAQRITTAMFKAMRETPQVRIAEMTGISTSALSRMLNEKGDDDRTALERFAAVLAALDQRTVPARHVAVDPDELKALRLLAAQRCLEGAPESEMGGL